MVLLSILKYREEVAVAADSEVAEDEGVSGGAAEGRGAAAGDEGDQEELGDESRGATQLPEMRADHKRVQLRSTITRTAVIKPTRSRLVDIKTSVTGMAVSTTIVVTTRTAAVMTRAEDMAGTTTRDMTVWEVIIKAAAAAVATTKATKLNRRATNPKVTTKTKGTSLMAATKMSTTTATVEAGAATPAAEDADTRLLLILQVIRNSL